ncbi:hypothetical protein scyTo_0022047, partial [Scyliorhinus torazame]|nr:hypothetical protein [Scyliorhinus torazame]
DEVQEESEEGSRSVSDSDPATPSGKHQEESGLSRPSKRTSPWRDENEASGSNTVAVLLIPHDLRIPVTLTTDKSGAAFAWRRQNKPPRPASSPAVPPSDGAQTDISASGSDTEPSRSMSGSGGAYEVAARIWEAELAPLTTPPTQARGGVRASKFRWRVGAPNWDQEFSNSVEQQRSTPDSSATEGTITPLPNDTALSTANAGSLANKAAPPINPELDTIMNVPEQATILDDAKQAAILNVAGQDAILDVAEQGAILNVAGQDAILDVAGQDAILDVAEQGAILDVANQAAILDVSKQAPILNVQEQANPELTTIIDGTTYVTRHKATAAISDGGTSNSWQDVPVLMEDLEHAVPSEDDTSYAIASLSESNGHQSTLSLGPEDKVTTAAPSLTLGTLPEPGSEEPSVRPGNTVWFASLDNDRAFNTTTSAIMTASVDRVPSANFRSANAVTEGLHQPIDSDRPGTDLPAAVAQENEVPGSASLDPGAVAAPVVSGSRGTFGERPTPAAAATMLAELLEMTLASLGQGPADPPPNLTESPLEDGDNPFSIAAELVARMLRAMVVSPGLPRDSPPGTPQPVNSAPSRSSNGGPLAARQASSDRNTTNTLGTKDTPLYGTTSLGGPNGAQPIDATGVFGRAVGADATPPIGHQVHPLSENPHATIEAKSSVEILDVRDRRETAPLAGDRPDTSLRSKRPPVDSSVDREAASVPGGPAAFGSKSGVMAQQGSITKGRVANLDAEGRARSSQPSALMSDGPNGPLRSNNSLDTGAGVEGEEISGMGYADVRMGNVEGTGQKAPVDHLTGSVAKAWLYAADPPELGSKDQDISQHGSTAEDAGAIMDTGHAPPSGRPSGPLGLESDPSRYVATTWTPTGPFPSPVTALRQPSSSIRATLGRVDSIGTPSLIRPSHLTSGGPSPIGEVYTSRVILAMSETELAYPLDSPFGLATGGLGSTPESKASRNLQASRAQMIHTGPPSNLWSDAAVSTPESDKSKDVGTSTESGEISPSAQPGSRVSGSAVSTPESDMRRDVGTMVDAEEMSHSDNLLTDGARTADSAPVTDTLSSPADPAGFARRLPAANPHRRYSSAAEESDSPVGGFSVSTSDGAGKSGTAMERKGIADSMAGYEDSGADPGELLLRRQPGSFPSPGSERPRQALTRVTTGKGLTAMSIGSPGDPESSISIVVNKKASPSRESLMLEVSVLGLPRGSLRHRGGAAVGPSSTGGEESPRSGDLPHLIGGPSRMPGATNHLAGEVSEVLSLTGVQSGSFTRSQHKSHAATRTDGAPASLELTLAGSGFRPVPAVPTPPVAQPTPATSPLPAIRSPLPLLSWQREVPGSPDSRTSLSATPPLSTSIHTDILREPGPSFVGGSSELARAPSLVRPGLSGGGELRETSLVPKVSAWAQSLSYTGKEEKEEEEDEEEDDEEAKNVLEAAISDTDLMEVSWDDAEYWETFYYVSLVAARELLRRRRRMWARGQK